MEVLFKNTTAVDVYTFCDRKINKIPSKIFNSLMGNLSHLKIYNIEKRFCNTIGVHVLYMSS